jgi:hypothetical protein
VYIWLGSVPVRLFRERRLRKVRNSGREDRGKRVERRRTVVASRWADGWGDTYKYGISNNFPEKEPPNALSRRSNIVLEKNKHKGYKKIQIFRF